MFWNNEMVSNAGRPVYPDKAGGPIRVRLVQPDTKAILVSVGDDGGDGGGLPAGFDPSTSKHLGTRLINARKELSIQTGPNPAPVIRPNHAYITNNHFVPD